MSPPDGDGRTWMPRDYHVDVKSLPCDPDKPQGYYWKLYFQGERINGGVAANPKDGRTLGSIYAHRDDSCRWQETHFWDGEETRWIPKSQL